MNKNQETLIELAAAAVLGKDQPCLSYEEHDWESIFASSVEHEISALVYPVIEKTDLGQKPDRNLMEKWKKHSLLLGSIQIINYENIRSLLAEFSKEGIPIIALKGLVLRELYPHPEFRTMSDIDLLIKKEDLGRIKNILARHGYSEDKYEYDPKLEKFIHPYYLSLELHWSLIDETHISVSFPFEKSAWKNSVPAPPGGLTAYTLSVQDQFLYTVLHMAGHMLFNGFGLRMLCDYVLLFEKYKNSIDWEKFVTNARECGVEHFTKALSYVCCRLSGLEIPAVLRDNYFAEDYKIDMFIDDILAGGIFGNNSAERVSANKMLHYSGARGNTTFKNKILSTLAFLFPPPKRLGMKYAYAQKFPILTPAAWIHRLIYNIRRKDYVFNSKINFLYSSSSFELAKSRAFLLQWLKLK